MDSLVSAALEEICARGVGGIPSSISGRRFQPPSPPPAFPPPTPSSGSYGADSSPSPDSASLTTAARHRDHSTPSPFPGRCSLSLSYTRWRRHSRRPSSPTPLRSPPPAPCWTSEETLALIDSYREKWFSLGSNKVVQIVLGRSVWDEVKTGIYKLSKFLRGNAGLMFTNLSKEEMLSCC